MVKGVDSVRKAKEHLARAEAIESDPRVAFHLRQARQLLIAHEYSEEERPLTAVRH